MDRKLLGIASVLALVVAATAIVSPNFVSGYSIEQLLFRTSLYGILSLGAAFVIVTGGIDLSIGSVLCLVGLMPPWLMTEYGWSLGAAVPAALAVAALLGLLHGVLVTRLGLQPFVVTLCGLLVYRGVARGLTRDQSIDFGEHITAVRWLVDSRWEVAPDFAVRLPMLIALLLTVLATLFMTRTVYGRYLLALGRNAEAARLSGIPVQRMTVAAYTISAVLAGIGGLLFVIDSGGGKASTLGNFYELYAIAGAVLGGCSLRGGEVSIPGVLLGAALMRVLLSAITQTGISTEIEFAIVGGVILLWVVAEESLKRLVAARRRRGVARSQR